jgi:hypothetical protein
MIKKVIFQAQEVKDNSILFNALPFSTCTNGILKIYKIIFREALPGNDLQ